MNPIYLGVNIDHVATLRQARNTLYPDPIYAAMLAEEAGADGITVHLREDRRHIQKRDVLLLKEVIQTRMNLEMAVTDEMLDFAEQIQPVFCCLVPEKREELTTEGGLDVVSQFKKIQSATERLNNKGICVSLFIDPDLKQIEAAAACKAPYIEIHTGHYTDARDINQSEAELTKIIQAAKFAKSVGLHVNAGHGLNYQNVIPIAKIDEIVELNIGHGIIARALFVGMKEAVAEMKKLMIGARF